MMVRVRTPLFTRNPYLFGDSTWGLTYVTHGLAGVGLVGLVIAHVYFAVRPDKWWITKSMIFGFITRRQYLEHHEPNRWAVPGVRSAHRSADQAFSTRVSTTDTQRAEFDARCNSIEEAYEFFLAYASQGLPSDQGSATGQQVREYLKRCDDALKGLGASAMALVERLGVDVAPYRAFVEVINRDASDARAAIQLVLAHPAIGSQLIDNLNASIHLRALLTDLFLIDEALKNR